MDEIEQAKEALDKMNVFMDSQIKQGNLKNVGYTDGHSEEYKFHDLSIIKVFEYPMLKHNETVFFDGDEKISSIYIKDGDTTLDNEEQEEIEAVLNLYENIKPHMEATNLLQEKNKEGLKEAFKSLSKRKPK
jgi:hypothetical protein